MWGVWVPLPAKPMVIGLNLGEIPTELRGRKQWVVWRYLPPVDGKDKWRKVPYQTNGTKAATDAPVTWTDFANALSACEGGGFDGIGYVFSASDPYVGIDWDHAYDDGVAPAVLPWLQDLNTYCELSTSGTGIHALLKARYPFDRGRKSQQVEIYKTKRFFCMTGRRFDTLPAEPQERQEAFDRLVAYYFPADPGSNGHNRSVGVISFDDAQIIERCRHATNSQKFLTLWEGNWESLNYPSRSEAEYALLGILKFWTKEEAQLARLMNASGLRRTKWESKRGQDTYLTRSIGNTVAAGGESYASGPTPVVGRHRNGQTNLDDLADDDLAELLAESGDSEEESAVENTKPRYTLHWADEALGDIPPIDWVVDELFARGSVSLIVGAPATKKTYSMLDCGVCVAMGDPWLGKLTQQGTVLVIDEESGDRRLKRRLKRLLRGHELGLGVPIAHTSLEMFNLLSSPADYGYIDGLMEQLKPALVIIDALADVMPGGDENSVKDTHPVFQKLRALAERHNCAVAVIHHATKQGGYRGSSAIAGAVDLMLMVESEKGQTSIVFKTEKSRDTEPFQFGGQLVFDEALESVRMIKYHVDPSAEEMGKGEKFVLNFLREHGGKATLGEIASSADTCSAATARRSVYVLVDKKRVQRTNAGRQGEEAEYGLA